MLVITGENLNIPRFIRAIRDGEEVSISDDARWRIKRSYEVLESIVNSGAIVYGVNTGVGELARVRLPIERSREFQKKLVLSHSVSMGDYLPPEVVLGAMIIRLNAFARGYSGVRPDVVDLLLEFVNRGIIPRVREKGSLGASGDLALLAGVASCLVGEGDVWFNGKTMPASNAIEMCGLKPVELCLKDGLALINGTSFTTSLAAFCVNEAFKQFRAELILSSILVEIFGGKLASFDPVVNSLRPSKGQNLVASYIRRFVKGSSIIDKPISLHIQDPYSIRCIPQIMGGIYDILCFARDVVTREMNTVSDNPLVLVDRGEVLSCGNFHAEAIALALDSASIAISELGSLSERHINRLLDPNLSGLPPFLAKSGGINSGLMLLHYVAWDTLAENKVITHPASTGTPSVSAQQEDHSSLSFLSARKLRDLIKNNWIILSAELVCVLQALDVRGVNGASSSARWFYEIAREKVPRIDEDRLLYPILDSAKEFLENLSPAY